MVSFVRIIPLFISSSVPGSFCSPRAAPLKKSLKVEKIEPKDFPAAAKIASVWGNLANEKMGRAEEGARPKFDDCALICQCISRRLQTGSFDEAYLCKDEDGGEQGMMLIKTKKEISSERLLYRGQYLEIAYLVTHPRNIRCGENKNDPDRVEGAGTALIGFAEKRAGELGREGVYLEGILNAKSFYVKTGFTEISTTRIENGQYAMVKTVEKVSRVAAA